MEKPNHLIGACAASFALPWAYKHVHVRVYTYEKPTILVFPLMYVQWRLEALLSPVKCFGGPGVIGSLSSPFLSIPLTMPLFKASADDMGVAQGPLRHANK